MHVTTLFFVTKFGGRSSSRSENGPICLQKTMTPTMIKKDEPGHHCSCTPVWATSAGRTTRAAIEGTCDDWRLSAACTYYRRTTPRCGTSITYSEGRCEYRPRVLPKSTAARGPASSGLQVEAEAQGTH